MFNVKDLANATIIRYIVTFIGGIVVAKGWIPVEVWNMFGGGIDDFIIVLLGGGGLVAALIAAGQGVKESKTDKIQLDGERIVIPKPGDITVMPSKTQLTAVKDVYNEAGDRLLGKAK